MKGLLGIVAAGCLLGQGAPETSSSLTSVEELAAAPFAPRIAVIDTISSLGPLAREPRAVDLRDLVQFHGHACDGLVAAAAGLVYGLRHLFPSGPVDRTDLEVAVNGSACYGDVAAYLTGARHRYGTLHVDSSLGDEWLLRRRSTGQTLRIRLREGVKSSELPELEKALRDQECPAALILRVQRMQGEFAFRLVNEPPEALFALEFPAGFPYPEGRPRPDTVKAHCPREP